MYGIGLSSCGKKLDEELFCKYKAAGINYIEISFSDTDAQETLDLEKIKEYAHKHEIILWSAHLPFGPFSEIDISVPSLADFTVSYYCGLIEKYAKVGINRFVVHPSGEPIMEEERTERLECAKKSLKKLAEFADKFGGVIAVENLPRTCLGKNSEEIAELISADERLVVCFDTNHLLNEDPIRFVKKMDGKIATIHVSDYDFTDEKHWLPGEGDINWKAMIDALKITGYSGPWLYEVFFECPKTIERPRLLTCEDFAENAKAIFKGESIPKIK